MSAFYLTNLRFWCTHYYNNTDFRKEPENRQIISQQGEMEENEKNQAVISRAPNPIIDLVIHICHVITKKSIVLQHQMQLLQVL